ncbi:MAG: type II toxin-antitoxin system VapC family toxin [Dehalococcoidia bacterium]
MPPGHAWIVEYLRGNTRIIQRVQELQEDDLAISIISVAELYEGVFRSRDPSKNEAALTDFLAAVTVSEITSNVARTYGQLRAGLVKAGAVIGALDLLIAATALTNERTLFSFDRDFQRIDGLSLQMT